MLLRKGEWWNDDAEEVEREMMRTGDGPKISEAYTINGMPGPLYPCSNKGEFVSLQHILSPKSNFCVSYTKRSGSQSICNL